MSKRKLYCFCREEEKGFMIQCDTCNLWFHGRCVNMNKKSSDAVENWHCVWCNQHRNSAETLIKEQDKIRRDILKIQGDLEHLKAAVKIHEGDLASETRDDAAFIDPQQKSSEWEELDVVKKKCGQLLEENNGLKKKYEDILTEIDVLKRELASQKEESDSVKNNFQNLQEEKQCIERNLQLKLDEAYSEINSLKQSNKELENKIAVQNRRKLSLSRR